MNEDNNSYKEREANSGDWVSHLNAVSRCGRLKRKGSGTRGKRKTSLFAKEGEVFKLASLKKCTNNISKWNNGGAHKGMDRPGELVRARGEGGVHTNTRSLAASRTYTNELQYTEQRLLKKNYDFKSKKQFY